MRKVARVPVEDGATRLTQLPPSPRTFHPAVVAQVGSQAFSGVPNRHGPRSSGGAHLTSEITRKVRSCFAERGSGSGVNLHQSRAMGAALGPMAGQSW